MDKETYEKMTNAEKKQFIEEKRRDVKKLADMIGDISLKWQDLSKSPQEAIEHFRQTESLVMFDKDDNFVYPCGMEYKAGSLHFQHLEHCCFCEDFFEALKSFLWIDDEYKKFIGEQEDK